MFDVRRKIKIYIKDSQAMYGKWVEQGGFPVFSVDTNEEAKKLVEAYPFTCTDSLTSYAARVQASHGKGLHSGEHYLAHDINLDMAKDMLKSGPKAGPSSPIASAILEENE